MSFYEKYLQYKDFDFDRFFNNITESDVLRSVEKKNLNIYDFLSLLSPTAEKCLEEMAEISHKLSLQNFGKTILLYTPMYLANYCVNKCAYCSFNMDNNITRRKLTMKEIEREAKAISETGLRHILILTGESKQETPLSYIVDSVKILKKYFASIALEIYPLSQVEYSKIIAAGVDGLTIYQEVYDEVIYDKVHIAGPKKNYSFRLAAPERAPRFTLRNVNLGTLLGLSDWRKEAFFTGLHGKYLQDKYSDVEISVSLPRIRPHVGYFSDVYPVSDKNLVQILLATRIFLPPIGITISTRENSQLRDNLIPLGVTKMSAGVTTEVGGHSSKGQSHSQFEISDNRNVQEIKAAILSKGYQPVFKNWMQL